MGKLFLHIKDHLKWYVLLVLVFLGAVLWTVVLREDRKGILTFTVLDVGQGDALYIESPTGTQVLIDGGPDKNLMKEIRQVMPWYDRHIDMLVVTNPDLDHYSGFIPLLGSYSVDVVIESGTRSTTPQYATLEKEIAKKNIPRIVVRRGQVVDLGGGAYLHILFPDRDISGLSSNDGSLIMKLVYGDTSVILQGDSTVKIEEYLISLNKGELQSTILKTGHHGSRTSTAETYVAAVGPLWAVISSATDNSYGHPHKEVLDTLERADVSVLATCAMGRIVFTSDGKEFVLENKKITDVSVGCKK